MKNDNSIIEGNKAIAEFDGWIEIPESENGNVPKHYERGEDWMNTVDDFKYHVSWDYFVPVWKKFADLNINDTTYRNHLFSINHAVLNFSFDIVHARLIRAIQWYNANQTKIK